MYNLTESIENICYANEYLNEEIEILQESTLDNLFEANDLLDEAFDILEEIEINGYNYDIYEISEALDYVDNIVYSANETINESCLIIDEGIFLNEGWLSDKLNSAAVSLGAKAQRAKAEADKNRSDYNVMKNQTIPNYEKLVTNVSPTSKDTIKSVKKERKMLHGEEKRLGRAASRNERRSRFFNGLTSAARKAGYYLDPESRRQAREVKSQRKQTALAENVQLLLDYIG